MEIIQNRVIDSSENKYYTELDRQEFIVKLEIGEKLQVRVLDANDNVLGQKEFIAKYINCHFNLQWQDKGVKNKTVV